jgi:hypothetical protein
MTAKHTTHDGAGRQHRSAAPVIWPLFGPLQSVSIERGVTSTAETAVLFALAAAGAVLTYQAFRGYRRNGDCSMVLFGGGLFLLTVVHAGLKLSLTFVVPVVASGSPGVVFAVAGTSQVVDIVGLAAVFSAIFR